MSCRSLVQRTYELRKKTTGIPAHTITHAAAHSIEVNLCRPDCVLASICLQSRSRSCTPDPLHLPVSLFREPPSPPPHRLQPRFPSRASTSAHVEKTRAIGSLPRKEWQRPLLLAPAPLHVAHTGGRARSTAPPSERPSPARTPPHSTRAVPESEQQN